MRQRLALLLAAAGLQAGRPALAGKLLQQQRLWVRLVSATRGSHAREAAGSAAAPAPAAAAGVPPASSLGAPGAPQITPAAVAPLSTSHLERFIAERGIAARVVPQLGGAPPPPGCCELKSLIFLADGQPIVSALCCCVSTAAPFILQCMT